MDCSEFQIGTSDDLTDVVLDGAITPEFAVPKHEFPQRDPHTFYIRGPIRLVENPIVYSMRENGSQLIAFTSVENSRNLVKVDVRYEDSCETDFELMKMDIQTEQCGTVQPQWVVNCKKEMQPNPYELLNVITNKGEVITSDEQVIQLDSSVEALEFFVTNKEGNPAMVGPAYISNYESFQGESLVLIPTLAGVIAEGILLSSETTSANLKVEFNCQEMQDQNKV